MKYLLLALVLALLSCSQIYYIVRHAEKASMGTNMSSDVPLSDKGKERAVALKDILKKKQIAYIFSTNTIRAKATVQPTADYFGLKIKPYGPVPDAAFINLLRSRRGNMLVVGHSNTVNVLVDMLCNKKILSGDLNDSAYDNLFIVKKKGKQYFFSKQHYGAPAQ